MNGERTSEAGNRGTLVVERNAKVQLRLSDVQRHELARRLETFDLAMIGGTDIAQLGQADGKKLKEVLDDFLSRVDSDQGQALYGLCERINEGVQQADLLSLRDQILKEPQLRWWQRWFANAKKAAENAAKVAYDKAVTTASERTTRLNGFLNGLEGEVDTELGNLRQGVLDLEELKKQYREFAESFAVSVAVAQDLRQQARERVGRLKDEARQNADAVNPAIIDEAEAQLQQLESRALALETTFSRLPADWMVIQQIQAAGVTTYQEVVTTASERFNAIKMTLLTLNGLLRVKGVQMIADRQRQLDEHLTSVRGDLLSQVVKTAANAPGDNRLEQARQLQRIVEDTATMKQIVLDARQSNAQKFHEARELIEGARKTLLSLTIDQPTTKLE